MIKYAKYAVPYLLKAPRRNPVKSLAGFALAYLLLALSAIFLFIASFIWLSKTFGTEIAFAGLGAGLLIIAIGLLFILNRPKTTATPVPQNIAQDPLAKFVPGTVRDNPTIRKLLQQIGENPVTATATAVTVGMLLSRELTEDL